MAARFRPRLSEFLAFHLHYLIIDMNHKGLVHGGLSEVLAYHLQYLVIDMKHKGLVHQLQSQLLASSSS